MKLLHSAVGLYGYGTALASLNTVDSAMAASSRHQAQKVTRQEHGHQSGLTSIGDDQYSGGAGGLASAKQHDVTIKDLGAISPPAASWPSTRAMPTCPLDLAA